MRNTLIQSVMRVDGGAGAVARWGTMWIRNRLNEETVRLWTAAVVVPLDCGPRPRVDDTIPPEHKLRPIALSECLLNLVETGVVHEDDNDLKNGSNLGS